MLIEPLTMISLFAGTLDGTWPAEYIWLSGPRSATRR